MPEHTPAPTPNRAVYGFVMYLGFKLFFILYLIWIYVPTNWLKSLQITYFPSPYWAIAVPVLILTTLTVFAFIIYPGMGLLMTPNCHDLRTIHDTKVKQNKTSELIFSSSNDSNLCTCRSKTCKKAEFDSSRHLQSKNNVPALEILNMVNVSEHLYLK